jgi:hypothetical protein
VSVTLSPAHAGDPVIERPAVDGLAVNRFGERADSMRADDVVEKVAACPRPTAQAEAGIWSAG